MDLYFQGLAWLNKGMTPDTVARGRGFFDRALTADPGNVDALIGSGRADIIGGRFFETDPAATFLAAEAKLTRALSAVSDHAVGHLQLGQVYLHTRRAAQGIAECEHALALNRNLAYAHSCIGLGKFLIGRAEETEAHICEALLLSPRDTTAYISMYLAGQAKSSSGFTNKRPHGFSGQSRPTEIFRIPISCWPPSSAHLGRLDEARSAVAPDLLSIRPSLSPAFAPVGSQ